MMPSAPDTTTHPIGRFAPTPSGPLHFGSLIAATASYLNARTQNGHWRLRIDDLDGPRVVPGASEEILRQLRGYGFVWDGPVVYQSERFDAYRQALARLNSNGRLYVCACSRKQLRQRQPQTPWLYDGFCHHQAVAPDPRAMTPENSAWRFRPERETLSFDDVLQGPQSLDVPTELGDFVVKRADGIFGYHLACAVDDIAMQVTEVVRGEDLLTSSFAQLAIMQSLGHTPPRYAHHALASNPEGIKLSKKSRAPAIRTDQALVTLSEALRFLHHPPPPEIQTLTQLWDWAINHWQLERLKNYQAW
ncbi:MAG: tRNA glutamyl-Q(34) synthetase GluQRS [Hydrogenovibrio sp.]|uniref:tRNA glutamyl-Q(34) synthetase GluQRS n=1 Tax=Hydrogenovibrio sp. TaxID=2065821 RepID=UPI0028706E58|nr:tRNA glutamyl-Q(34) synthetase GluQRS [Hydrogenovibrio sp.]MDR9500077.1 tRNA glutamyl-Q(34) synthetase GluQRS [Hydrogenovibrio sp.]